MIGGIVLTGGGSQLKHISQLVNSILLCRVELHSNEHLASTSPIDVSSPMFATGVGLVMKALENEEDLETIPSLTNKNKIGKSGGLGEFFGGLLDKIDDYLGNDMK